jgi:hypothetical protein
MAHPAVEQLPPRNVFRSNSSAGDPFFLLSVISVTALAFRFDLSSRKPIGGDMSDPLGDTTARLQRLLEVVMQERDQAKCHELSEEIWQVLEEREAIKEALTERE